MIEMDSPAGLLWEWGKALSPRAPSAPIGKLAVPGKMPIGELGVPEKLPSAPIGKLAVPEMADPEKAPIGRLAVPEAVPEVTGDLAEYERWWRETGQAISEAVDRAGTPPLRMFDRFGARVDEILYPPEYRTMLQKGYSAGVIWRIPQERSLLSSYQIGYVTSFFDSGLYCPYTVSMSTVVPLSKYGATDVRERFLPRMLARDETVWQGATWMTEARGGSDLGANVETVARRHGEHWLLSGDKFFCSNVGAELAVVAARPEGASAGVRGLALFLVPRVRDDGTLNYHVRRLKPKIATRSVPTGEVELRASQAFLLGTTDAGIYLILEVLNLSRIANSIGSVAVTQRALAEVIAFARERVVFGKLLIEQPLLQAQLEERLCDFKGAFGLAWYAARMLNEVYLETPPYSERYHLFRLVAHLAKYHTAELAVQTSKWAMEVHGSAGVLDEFPVERLLRESMILAIWEGAPHRQILDALEVMRRKRAHELLFQELGARGRTREVRDLQARVDALLALDEGKMEARGEAVFRELASWTARVLSRK